ncbi:hypothetical protein [Dermatophilus congolensis]|nr:hypothetical protein [Dermatophilus congolensis]MBO3142696.1 hypothetical protein [Dermatophilus congolensis]MBO3162969.1 hypothetical protein [Dermatophilus congolensis]MBO3201863.1 hypothetical protein [Dermatophilus congolensis]MBO3217705.1 hypothetical protein [Dermatophilus congolensis]
MRFLWRKSSSVLPQVVRDAVTERGERVLAWAGEKYAGAFIVATTARLVVVDAQGEVVDVGRWGEVDSAVWEPGTATLSVAWVDGRRGSQWTAVGSATRLAESVHERVSRSVVVAVDLERDGVRIGRAAIRRDPQTQELFAQLVWARGQRPRDEERAAYGEAVLVNLCEQVGLPESVGRAASKAGMGS